MAVAQIQTNLEENLQIEIVAALEDTLRLHTDQSPEELARMVNDRFVTKYFKSRCNDDIFSNGRLSTGAAGDDWEVVWGVVVDDTSQDTGAALNFLDACENLQPQVKQTIEITFSLFFSGPVYPLPDDVQDWILWRNRLQTFPGD